MFTFLRSGSLQNIVSATSSDPNSPDRPKTEIEERVQGGDTQEERGGGVVKEEEEGEEGSEGPHLPPSKQSHLAPGVMDAIRSQHPNLSVFRSGPKDLLSSDEIKDPSSDSLLTPEGSVRRTSSTQTSASSSQNSKPDFKTPTSDFESPSVRAEANKRIYILKPKKKSNLESTKSAEAESEDGAASKENTFLFLTSSSAPHPSPHSSSSLLEAQGSRNPTVQPWTGSSSSRADSDSRFVDLTPKTPSAFSQKSIGILRKPSTPGTGNSVRFGKRLYDDGDESAMSASVESPPILARGSGRWFEGEEEGEGNHQSESSSSPSSPLPRSQRSTSSSGEEGGRVIYGSEEDEDHEAVEWSLSFGRLAHPSSSSPAGSGLLSPSPDFDRILTSKEISGSLQGRSPHSLDVEDEEEDEEDEEEEDESVEKSSSRSGQTTCSPTVRLGHPQRDFDPEEGVGEGEGDGKELFAIPSKEEVSMEEIDLGTSEDQDGRGSEDPNPTPFQVRSNGDETTETQLPSLQSYDEDFSRLVDTSINEFPNHLLGIGGGQTRRPKTSSSSSQPTSSNISNSSTFDSSQSFSESFFQQAAAGMIAGLERETEEEEEEEEEEGEEERNRNFTLLAQEGGRKRMEEQSRWLVDEEEAKEKGGFEDFEKTPAPTRRSIKLASSPSHLLPIVLDQPRFSSRLGLSTGQVVVSSPLSTHSFSFPTETPTPSTSKGRTPSRSSQEQRAADVVQGECGGRSRPSGIESSPPPPKLSVPEETQEEEEVKVEEGKIGSPVPSEVKETSSTSQVEPPIDKEARVEGFDPTAPRTPGYRDESFSSSSFGVQDWATPRWSGPRSVLSNVGRIQNDPSFSSSTSRDESNLSNQSLIPSSPSRFKALRLASKDSKRFPLVVDPLPSSGSDRLRRGRMGEVSHDKFGDDQRPDFSTDRDWSNKVTQLEELVEALRDLDGIHSDRGQRLLETIGASERIFDALRSRMDLEDRRPGLKSEGRVGVEEESNKRVSVLEEELTKVGSRNSELEQELGVLKLHLESILEGGRKKDAEVEELVLRLTDQVRRREGMMQGRPTLEEHREIREEVSDLRKILDRERREREVERRDWEIRLSSIHRNQQIMGGGLPESSPPLGGKGGEAKVEAGKVEAEGDPKVQMMVEEAKRRTREACERDFQIRLLITDQNVSEEKERLAKLLEEERETTRKLLETSRSQEKELLENLTSQTQRNLELEERCQVYDEDLKSSRNRVELLEERLEEFRLQAEGKEMDLVSELNQAERLADSRSEEIERLNLELGQVVEIKEKLREELEARGQVSESIERSEMQELVEEKQSALDQANRLRSELEAQWAQAEKAHDFKEKVLAEKARLEQELTDAVKRLQEDCDLKLRLDEAETKLSLKDEELLEANRELQRLTTELYGSRVEAEQLQARFKELAEREATRKRENNQRLEALAAKSQTLYEAVQKYERDDGGLRNHLSEVSDLLFKTQRELEEAREELEEAEGRVEELEQETDGLKLQVERVSQMETEMGRMRVELDKVTREKDEVLDSLRGDIETKRETIASLNLRIQEQEARIAGGESDASNLRRQLVERETKIQELDRLISASEIELQGVRTDLMRSKKEISSLEQELFAERDSTRQIGEEKQSKDLESQRLQQRINSLLTERETLTLYLERLRVEKVQAEESLREANEQRKRDVSAQAGLRTEKEGILREKEELLSSLADLENYAETKSGEVREAELKLSHARSRIEMLEVMARDSELTNLENSKLVDQLRSSILSKQSDQEQPDLGSLRSELENLRKQLDQLTIRNAKLEHEVADRGIQILKLNKAKDRLEDENTNFGIALSAKQLELSMLKRKARNSGVAFGVDKTPTSSSVATPLTSMTSQRNRVLGRLDVNTPGPMSHPTSSDVRGGTKQVAGEEGFQNTRTIREHVQEDELPSLRKGPSALRATRRRTMDPVTITIGGRIRSSQNQNLPPPASPSTLPTPSADSSKSLTTQGKRVTVTTTTTTMPPPTSSKPLTRRRQSSTLAIRSSLSNLTDSTTPTTTTTTTTPTTRVNPSRRSSSIHSHDDLQAKDVDRARPRPDGEKQGISPATHLSNPAIKHERPNVIGSQQQSRTQTSPSPQTPIVSADPLRRSGEEWQGVSQARQSNENMTLEELTSTSKLNPAPASKGRGMKMTSSFQAEESGGGKEERAAFFALDNLPTPPTSQPTVPGRERLGRPVQA